MGFATKSSLIAAKRIQFELYHGVMVLTPSSGETNPGV